MVILIPNPQKSVAATANRPPINRRQVFEVVAMTAFIVATFLFAEVAPALVN
jgi:hypothetical protein